VRSQKLIRVDRQSRAFRWKKNSYGGLPQCDICQQIAPEYSHDFAPAKVFRAFFSFSFLFVKEGKKQKSSETKRLSLQN